MKTYTVVTLAALLGAGTMAMAASEEPDTAMHSTGAMSAEAHIAQMEAHLKQMQAELDAISKIKDPVERRVRYKKHLQEMTNMMHQMNEARPTMTAKEQQLHSKMLEKRLDMLQQMLTQVVKIQARLPAELRPQQDW